MSQSLRFDPGTGAFAPNQYVSDLVGWGSSNVFEGSAADVADLGPATSLTRAPGAVDTDDNSADLTAGATTPNASPELITWRMLRHCSTSFSSRKTCNIEGTKCSVVMPCS